MRMLIPANSLLVAACFFCGASSLVAQSAPLAESGAPDSAKETAPPDARVIAPDDDRNVNSARVEENQFAIWTQSGDLRERAALAKFARSLNEDFDRIFGLDGSWRVPIRVELFGELGVDGGRQQARVIRQQVGEGFRIKLQLKLPEGFDNRWLERQFISVLIREQMLSGPAAKELYSSLLPETDPGAESSAREVLRRTEAPYWLTMGIAELIDHYSKGRPSELYSRLVRSRQVLPIDQVLTATQESIGEDSLSRSIFRGSAGALVAALLKQGNGEASTRKVAGANFCRWMADLPGSDGTNVEALFRQHFPGLRTGQDSLSKWWALQVATMGQMQALEFHDPENTEKVITAALEIRLPKSVISGEVAKPDEGAVKRVLGWFSGKGDEESFAAGRLHDFEKFQDHPHARIVLEACRQRLVGVKVRGFPLYRPVLEKYAAAAERLIKGGTGGVGKLLEEADQQRVQTREVMARVRDFMNYHEATQVRERSGDFEAYERTLKDLRSKKPPPRDDRISKHLDAIEVEFE
jgi:hypothetical protein